MEISGIFSAILVGLVIGVLARLLLPGKQRIGILWTIAAGIVAALVGTAVAQGFGVAETEGVDWLELAVQLGLAMLAVGGLGQARARR